MKTLMSRFGLICTTLLVLSAGAASISQAAEICWDCHAPLMAKKNQHPGALQGCDNCHVAHNEPTTSPDRLLDDTNKLCFQCHDEKKLLSGGTYPVYGAKQVGHPVLNHPVTGFKDPLYPQRDFTCVSCHSPHSSDNPKLFRYDFGPKTPYKGTLCAVCHWKKLMATQPETPSWGAIYPAYPRPVK